MPEINGLMKGKVCLVTGANSGIGKVTAQELARMGAQVIMVCRDKRRGEEAKAEITAATANPQVDLMTVDLASQAAISQFAKDFKAHYDRLHVLVNNAGIALSNRTLTPDGLEATFAVNHLAYFLLTELLLDTLKASAPARIVNVSSEAQSSGKIAFDDLQAEKKYSQMQAYSQSKLANVLFTYELARRLQDTGVTANCLHPGAVKTNFAQGSTGFFGMMLRLARPFEISPEKGAETSIYLASSPEVEGVSGKYFSKKQPKQSSTVSYDPAIRQRLWEESARLTGLKSRIED